MFRVPFLTATNRKSFTSGFALAVALAAGGTIGATAVATPAYAQEYSKDWRKAASPVSDGLDATDKDEKIKALAEQVKNADDATRPALMAELDSKLDGALTKLPTLEPLIQTDDDKYTTGSFYLNFGNLLNQADFQRKGLIMMLDSGKTAPEQVGLFNFFAGNLSWNIKNYEAARKYLSASLDAGYEGDNTERFIIESYFEEGRNAEGLERLSQLVEQRGAKMPEDPLRRGLQLAYEENLADWVDVTGANLVRFYPTAENWNSAARAVVDTGGMDSQEALDLYRLLERNNALNVGRDYVDYIEAADARRMSNEVKPLIEEAISRGMLQADDVFVQEIVEIVGDRAQTDRDEADMLADEARSAANGVSARAAGDNFMSFGESAKAEEMFKLSLEKGGVDKDQVMTRLGIVQADQGKYDEARVTFGQVGGKRAAIARLWLAYIDVESGAVVPAG